MRVDSDPFKDPRVRKAVRMAINPEATLKIAHRGLGAPGESHHVAPVHPEYVKTVFKYNDPEGAKKLLAEAGHPDGIEVTLNCKKDPDWEAIACQAMVQQWAKAGIKVKLEVMPSANYWDVWTKVPFGFTNWTHRPLGVMVLALAYRTGVPWNESGYSNPKFDALITKAEGILDVEKRKVVMKEIEELMDEDGPIALPLWRAILHALRQAAEGLGAASDRLLLCGGMVSRRRLIGVSTKGKSGGPGHRAAVSSCSGGEAADVPSGRSRPWLGPPASSRGRRGRSAAAVRALGSGSWRPALKRER
jgi:ABC-type transport system substrate-binding protein